MYLICCFLAAFRSSPPPVTPACQQGTICRGKSQQPGARAAAGNCPDFETPAQPAIPSGRDLARGLLSSFSAASMATPDVDAIPLGDDYVNLT